MGFSLSDDVANKTINIVGSLEIDASSHTTMVYIG
jgi:hypothetical protein